MNNAVLLIAHAPLASALREAALHVFPDAAADIAALDVQASAAPEDTLAQAHAAQAQLGGRPLLVLADCFGATPCNVAQRLVAGAPDLRLIAGASLPMLLRAVTYRSQPLTRWPSAPWPAACRAPCRWAAARHRTSPEEHRMIKNDTTISNKLGLHARASAKLTKLAGSYPCEVWMSRGERRVNAKSIMGVMMLAAGIGSQVTLETDGEQEQEAMEALLALINDKFGEGE